MPEVYNIIFINNAAFIYIVMIINDPMFSFQHMTIFHQKYPIICDIISNTKVPTSYEAPYKTKSKISLLELLIWPNLL